MADWKPLHSFAGIAEAVMPPVPSIIQEHDTKAAPPPIPKQINVATLPQDKIKTTIDSNVSTNDLSVPAKPLNQTANEEFGTYSVVSLFLICWGALCGLGVLVLMKLVFSFDWKFYISAIVITTFFITCLLAGFIVFISFFEKTSFRLVSLCPQASVRMKTFHILFACVLILAGISIIIGPRYLGFYDSSWRGMFFGVIACGVGISVCRLGVGIIKDVCRRN